MKIEIAIIGRRNVGKSTLFNAMAGKKRSIVADIPGVTRDCIAYPWNGVNIYDTPGLDLQIEKGSQDKKTELEREIKKRTEAVIDKVNLVLFMVSYPELYPFDEELADLVRKKNKTVIMVINKVDDMSFMDQLSDYYGFGIPEVVPISAKNKKNLDLLYEKIRLYLKKDFNVNWSFEREPKPESDEKATRVVEHSITIVGRPNCGKSTLLNALCGKELSLVSSIPGTTRDSVDSQITYHGKKITIIDTAGIRKQGKRSQEVIERFSFLRTEDAIRRSQAVLHIMDAQEGITDTDKKIFDITQKAGKQILLVINKWDLISGNEKDLDKYWRNQLGRFPMIKDLPIISISALTGLRMSKIMERIQELLEGSGKFISTSLLNKLFGELSKNHRIVSAGGRFRIYYLTQVDIHPPTFVLFVNHPDLIRKNAEKYIEKQIKEALDLKNNVIRIFYRGRERKP